MKSIRLIQTMLSAAIWLVAGPASAIHFADFEDVQSKDGNPSPSQAESQVNDYRFQDEQINVDPDDGVIKVLRTDQKILINEYTTAVFPLRHAVRREIRSVMRQVTKLEGGRAEVFKDPKSGDSYVQVIAPKFMIPYLEKTIAALDVDWLAEYRTGASDVYRKVLHRGAADVDEIAEAYAGDEGFSTIDTTTTPCAVMTRSTAPKNTWSASKRPISPVTRWPLRSRFTRWTSPTT